MLQPHCKCTVRWPYGDIWFLPCLQNHTAALRQLYGALTVGVRQTCGSCNNREGTVRVPYGHLPVSLWSPYGFLFHESYDRRAVAATFVTTITTAGKTLWFLRIKFTHRRPQNHKDNVNASWNVYNYGSFLSKCQLFCFGLNVLTKCCWN